MRCEEARERMSELRYGGEPSPQLEQHLSMCAGCRAVQSEQTALDGWLTHDEPAAAGPGFDTRFFARLERERVRSRRRRWAPLGFALLPVAAAVALVVLRRTPTPEAATPPLPAPLSQAAPIAQVEGDDLDLALDIELVEDLDVVQHMDELEDYDALAAVDEQELERLIEETP